MAKASSNDILGLGKPLGSGPGAIRQFWNPIKPAMAPAAAWLKPAPTTFWAWGLWDRDRNHPSVLKSHKTREGASRTSVFKPHKTSQGASRCMAKASSNDILGLGKPLLKSHKTREGASRSMAKAGSNDILGLGKPWGRDRGPSVSFETP